MINGRISTKHIHLTTPRSELTRVLSIPVSPIRTPKFLPEGRKVALEHVVLWKNGWSILTSWTRH